MVRIEEYDDLPVCQVEESLSPSRPSVKPSPNDYSCPPDHVWEPPCTLHVDYWKRTPECAARKEEHTENLDKELSKKGSSREDEILHSTLKVRKAKKDPRFTIIIFKKITASIARRCFGCGKGKCYSLR